MNRNSNVSSGLEKWRFNTIYFLLGAILLVYIIRLFSLQIIHGADYLAQAEENRLQNVSVPTQRGNIYDRNGYVLAKNIASYDVAITPAYLPVDIGSTEKIYRELSEYIGIPVTNGVINDSSVKLFTPCQTDFGIKEIVLIGDTNAPYQPVKVKCNVDEKIAMIIREKSTDWPGVSIVIEPIRQYPTGSLTAEIVGFLGPITAENEDYYVEKGFVAGRDKVGFGGVEYQLDEILIGKNGERVIEVDNAGKEIRDVEAPSESVTGNSMRLTIDTRLQAAARTALVAEMDFWNTYLGKIKSQNGVVIAMNPKTGEILAMVSYPTYENNRLERIIPAYYYNQLSQDPLKPLLNHAISAQHPPGSVFKMAAAIGALNERVVTPNQLIACPGTISIIQKYSPNDPGTPRLYYGYDRAGHGMCDFVKSVGLSDDIYFYKIGGGYENEIPNGGLGAWRLAEYARALGYGRLTGIELPGEVAGLIPDPTWKRIYRAENWSTGDTYITTIGQGYVLATPLQVLQSFAILANDGKYMKPTIVKDILDSKGNVVIAFEPTLIWDITKDPLINVLDENNKPTGEKKIVESWVIDYAKAGMRKVVVDGTATKTLGTLGIPSAGKTGTAEYCDNVAQEKNLCMPENWPTHSWYVGYAPYDNPEIVVIAFVYNGGEGASVAAPIVGRVLETYFDLKAIDSTAAGTIETLQ
ncbi:MAG: penicillin-binding protein 2 [Chloroflexi bacterium]|nr:MAG: penicillin-binding protein 2 [Chloroflexota bacterium]